MDIAVVALSLAAPLVGFAGVIVGTRVSTSQQRMEWARDRKLHAIAAFIEESTLLLDRLRRVTPGTPDERAQWMHALQSGRTTIHLLCNQSTRDDAERLVKLIRSVEGDPSDRALRPVISALNEFIEVARAEVSQ